MLPIRQALTSAPPTGGICGRVLPAVGIFLIGSALCRVSPPVSQFKRASSSPRLVSSTAGSEEGRRSATLRPPLKPDAQFSRIRLSQELRGFPPCTDSCNQVNKIYQAVLAAEPGFRQLPPPAVAPALLAM